MLILQPTHLILHEEENLIKYAKKASAQNRAKALKIMRFLGLVASQGGLFHLPENTFLKKVLQKRLNTKIFISDKPEVAVVKVMLILRYYSSELRHSFFSLCVSIQNIERAKWWRKLQRIFLHMKEYQWHYASSNS